MSQNGSFQEKKEKKTHAFSSKKISIQCKSGIAALTKQTWHMDAYKI